MKKLCTFLIVVITSISWVFSSYILDKKDLTLIEYFNSRVSTIFISKPYLKWLFIQRLEQINYNKPERTKVIIDTILTYRKNRQYNDWTQVATPEIGCNAITGSMLPKWASVFDVYPQYEKTYLEVSKEERLSLEKIFLWDIGTKYASKSLTYFSKDKKSYAVPVELHDWWWTILHNGTLYHPTWWFWNASIVQISTDWKDILRKWDNIYYHNNRELWSSSNIRNLSLVWSTPVYVYTNKTPTPFLDKTCVSESSDALTVWLKQQICTLRIWGNINIHFWDTVNNYTWYVLDMRNNTTDYWYIIVNIENKENRTCSLYKNWSILWTYLCKEIHIWDHSYSRDRKYRIDSLESENAVELLLNFQKTGIKFEFSLQETDSIWKPITKILFLDNNTFQLKTNIEKYNQAPWFLCKIEHN